jgi:predicted ArsR family transcriptional regulator
VRLRNCPFHPLAARAPEVMCQINHAYLAGLVDGLDAPAVEAVLDPESRRMLCGAAPAPGSSSLIATLNPMTGPPGRQG